MAVCEWCNEEMMKGCSCSANMEVEFPDGTKMPSIPYEDEEQAWGEVEGRECPDCGTPHGGFHHPGCDMERCPRCNGQLIGCGCLDDNDE